MTVMSRDIKAAHNEQTILDVVRRFQKYQIHLVEARAAIMPAFGVTSDDCSRQGLVDYLDSILDRVHSQEIDAETAASDIWEMAQASQSGNSDLDWLLEIGAE
ncbi:MULTISPECIES: hypothetical protein [Asticcacaulis]|uniref:hypothetical protein n=1 Tax=Asticcacaulis TaxID=76890 RepID=UPI001AEA941F|nr:MULTISPECIES: hypothetical protein [Asticcacaulis]MBP2159564.1 hypothetical protein [Asticcacaulis solisilvae]MDR6800609.1 hypothetical protein [Asticcacaulis sp. BE141]